MRVLVVAGIIMTTLEFSGAGDRPTGHQCATRSEVVARHGMAATSQPLATQVAIDILKEGGSAVDAAIAAMPCLATTSDRVAN